MIFRLTSCIVFVHFFSGIGYAQEVPDLQFSTFIGKVYQLPADSLQKGFRPYINNLDPYTTVEWTELNFPKRASDDYYPGIDLGSSYGIDFHSQLTVTHAGVYLFGLKSDDGSRLWIDNQLLLNNDVKSKDRKGHMELCADSIALDKGVYDIRIWYCQAYPTAMGIQFKAKMIREIDGLPQRLPVQLSIYFDSDQSVVSPEDSLLLINTLEGIENINDSSISILGYTDDIGSAEYNVQLSKDRAESVKALIDLYTDGDLSIVIKGLGEVVAKGENRSQHRRVDVEILLNGHLFSRKD